MSKNGKENQTLGELSPKQAQVLTMLMAGASQREAAGQAGVNEATVSRWMHNDPAFIAAYRAELQSLYDAVTAESLDYRRTALRILAERLNGDNRPAQVKAAELILKHTAMPRPVGETDPAVIALALEQAARDREWVEMLSI